MHTNPQPFLAACAAMHCDVLSDSRNKVLEVSLSKYAASMAKAVSGCFWFLGFWLFEIV